MIEKDLCRSPDNPTDPSRVKAYNLWNHCLDRP